MPDFAPVFPRLTVVGAGPGDPELFTLKGVRVLAEADVVLYDALANDELLSYAPASAPRIFVGKRRGQRTYAQEEINALIVDQSRRYGHVVRLKGGDPFVFGRGREEMLYAEAQGLTTAYVPGISSSVAVAGNVGIPLTHRGLSEGFRVITATTASGELSGELWEAARSRRTTTVVLMGLSQLRAITSIFAQCGGAYLPAAVVQNGTLPSQRLVVGNVADLATKAEAAGIGAPAIIVIGEVVQLAEASLLQALPAEVLTASRYAKVA